MRSVLLISVSVFLVVVISGFCITWYVQSTHIRHNIEATIASLNSADAAHPYITYDRIETSGFPKAVMVTVINPRFKGRVDEFLEKIFSSASIDGPKPLFPENPAKWNEDISLEGSFNFAVNALSDQYSAVVRGTWHQNSVIDGKTMAMDNIPAGDAVCTMQLQRGSSIFGRFWEMNFTTSFDTFKEDFRMLDCNTPGSKTVDKSTGETLMSTGPLRIYMTNEKIEAMRNMRFYFKISDSEISAKGDERLRGYLLQLNPNNPAPTKFSPYGKQNMEIDISYAGPDKFDGINAKDANFSFTISKFDIANNVYRSDLAVLVSNALSADMRTSKLKFNSHFTFGEHYDAIMQDMLRGYVAQAYAKEDIAPPFNKTLRAQYSADQMYEILSPALPHFQSIGNMVLSFDLDATSNAALTNGNATLNRFELSAAPYGLTGKGSAKLEQPPIPSSDIMLSCRNCLQMVDDVAGYAQRLKKSLATFDHSIDASPEISPMLAEGYKKFLTSLGLPSQNPGEQQTLLFHVASTPQAGLSVNGRDMMATMQLYNQYVTPYLSKPAAQPLSAH